MSSAVHRGEARFQGAGASLGGKIALGNMTDEALTVLLIAICLSAAAWIMVGLVTYWREVLPALRRHGYKPDYPVGTWRAQWRQVQAYGRICRQDGLPLGRYRVLHWWWFAGPVLFVAFVVVGLLLERAHRG